MLTNVTHSEDAFEEPGRSIGLKLIAGICAVVVTAAVFSGYAYLRKRHAQQSFASATEALASSNAPKAPPKVHILVDDALLKSGQTIIGGLVKNISREKLSALSVELELRRRKDGAAELRSVPLDPPQLEPEKEGRYSLVLQAQDYGSVRLIGLKSTRRNGSTQRPLLGRDPHRVAANFLTHQTILLGFHDPCMSSSFPLGEAPGFKPLSWSLKLLLKGRRGDKS